jgi:hypothetical protein
MAQCLQQIFPLYHCAHRFFLYVPAVRGARATLRAASSAFCFLDLAGISLLTAPTKVSQQAVVKLTESLAPLTQSLQLQYAVQAPSYLPAGGGAVETHGPLFASKGIGQSVLHP